MKRWMKPKWKHDCAKCEYLGSMFIGSEFADWYVCDDGLSPSIIARFSNLRPEYWSSMPSIVENDKFLTSRTLDDEHVFSHMHILARFMLAQRNKEGEEA